MTILIEPYHLKVASAISTNLAAGFVLTIPAINNVFVLTGNIISAIVCIVLALKMERLLQNIYD